MSRCSPSQTVGPFFHLSLTLNPALGRMTRPGAQGALPTLGHVIAQALPGEKGARTVRQ